jgi:hypothetical protein
MAIWRGHVKQVNTFPDMVELAALVLTSGGDMATKLKAFEQALKDAPREALLPPQMRN